MRDNGSGLRIYYYLAGHPSGYVWEEEFSPALETSFASTNSLGWLFRFCLGLRGAATGLPSHHGWGRTDRFLLSSLSAGHYLWDQTRGRENID